MKNKDILFFDGDCPICSFWANFVMRHNHDILLSSLQSNFSKKFFGDELTHILSLNSLVFFSNNTLYIKTKAVTNILKKCGTGYKILAYGIQLVPLVLSNAVYTFCAKRRLLIGKRLNIKACDVIDSQRLLL